MLAITGLSTALAAAAAALCLGGCANLGYYWQSVSGHMQMLNAARPVDDWLGDSQTPQALKTRLALSQRIRSFAVAELKLPDNASYRRYADLHRSAAVWNVVAAPEFSLTLKTWCFPVAGCVGYRGYFSEAEARLEADRLNAEGLETSVYPVPAYSTLGLMNWAGGDPLLNTFIRYPEGELARLIFHELAHQVVYAQGDTVFNESFATAVERLGSQRWLATQAGDAARQEYARFDGRRRQFRALALATRRDLERIYAQNEAAAQEEQAQSAIKNIATEKAKARIMERFRRDYAQLKAGWASQPGPASNSSSIGNTVTGYDSWVARANNASLGALAAYDELVPGFEALFEREGRNWPRFYDAVKKLADRPKNERHQALSTPSTHQ
nr:aminopeptidase [Polaromonas sp.]